MRKFLISLVIIISLFMVFLTYNYFFVYHYELLGNKELNVDVNSEFKDPGIIIKYRGKLVKDYKVIKDLDISKLGSYLINYKKGKFNVTRKVNVKDLTGPEIKLEGEEVVNIKYKDKYEEPGFSAIDNLDGDVTDKVIVNNNIKSDTLGEYVVIYKVRDNTNNETVVKRVVNVVDDEAPIITFKSNEYRYAIVGKEIKLDDFKATDNYDGDVTDKVLIDNKIDYNKAGKYTVEYSVTDSNKNKTTVERQVSVQNKNTKGIPVLMYHWFYDDTKGEKAGTANTHNYIAKSELVKQLEYLTKNNFYFPTWQELIDYIDKKIDLPEKSIIITDDDCVDSFFYTALPVFQEYKVPVTSFCITNKSTWKKYIDAPYLDFESHTDSMHVRRCDTEWNGAVMCSTYKEIYNDIKVSIEKVKNTYSFAYPFGHYSDDTIQALKDNNIKLAFTINGGRVKPKSNKYKLPRVRISKDTTIDQYIKLVN